MEIRKEWQNENEKHKIIEKIESQCVEKVKQRL